MENRFIKILKKILIALGFIVLIMSAGIYASPYGNDEKFSYKLMRETVEIAAPIADVYQYLGKSENAKDWSVFVDHITPLNADEVRDGAVGSIRRCFVQADEKGVIWDELTTIVESNKRRQLTIYNLQGFPMTADNLRTEQLYKKISDQETKLTFTVFFAENPSLCDHLKMYYAAYQIKSIFTDNMMNIKKFVEQKSITYK